MKPNKQKIHSSQPLKPGSISKLQYLSKQNSKKPGHRNSVNDLPERGSEFELNSIVSNFKLKESPNPFKVLSFSSPKLLKEDIKKEKSFKFMSPHIRKAGRYSNLHQNEDFSENIKTIVSETVKDDEVCNKTTDTVKHKHESIDEYFGIFPNKYWCRKCGKDVISKVKMNLPTLSMWNRICFNSCIVTVDKYQEILHFCPNCGIVLEKVEPRAL